MKVPLRTLSCLFRVGVLALLVLGVMLKPMLSTMCETHSALHANAVQSLQHDHAESADEHVIDHAHATGAHGLLHEDDSSSAYADLVTLVVLPAIAFERLPLPAPASLAVPQKHIPGPFRPPIA